MQISASKLGPLENPQWSPKNLNVIAGPNGSGKTYLAHAIYLLLKGLSRSIRLSEKQISPVLEDLAQLLVDDHIVELGGQELIELVKELIERRASASTRQLESFLNAGDGEAQLGLQLTLDESTVEESLFKMHRRIGVQVKARSGDFNCNLEVDSSKRSATFTISRVENSTNDESENRLSAPDTRTISQNIKFLLEMAFSRSNPVPYILSAERTGISLFQQDIDFGRSRMVEEFRIEGEQALDGVDRSIWSPAIEDNFNTFRSLNRWRKSNSFLAAHHPEVLELFDRMVSGRFVEIDGAFKFAPEGAEGPIPMTSTSSTVRALFELGEFLRYRAQKGQWLIIDEPELNLHPQNQVLMGRLLAALSNAGLKILVTTHSDYIVRELSILVMLSQKDQSALPTGYIHDFVLSPEDVRVDYTEFEGDLQRSKLRSVEVTAEDGISTPFFDDAIRQQNDVFEEVMWG
ncbi:hypothetical protein YH66_13465 [[Brevibacterium] flavum]|uniref:AAA+ ATPase domain-containing protein n=1 Tax=[Brevibacterium] flavum TaxID=92706 RepID=A0A0F6SRS2_9CORY|nr:MULTISPECIES: AAA family ATPase [Corynebacterium]AKF28454.1 hypothetical protein YH66_13465 [[Brevibacterium] flavum]ANE09289.1 hypothetical protein A3654_13525 [Corynebacterium glutamicum]AST21699.1 ATP-binding protein [Corynebacterium glutamicum ATCC 14067]KEI24232.1 hypothetical protein KIQ_001330 [Corynebacterium glutamicum ATCC 14067]KIH72558.1 hypothetical protein SD36_13485 [Corynebacterium glutamicum]